MADSVKRLVGPQFLGNTATTVYTVPGSTTAVIRDIHVCNEDTTTEYKIILSIGTDAGGKRLLPGIGLKPKDVLRMDCLIGMDAGEIIQANADAANKITLTISGIETT